FAVPGAVAAERVALVIGNGEYRNATPLPNPRHDAEDVAAALRRAGFETVLGTDLDKSGMEEAAIRFARVARGAEVAMFYYSGHAMQFAGVNYLMPVDVSLRDEADLRRLIRVDDVLADLQQAKNLRILVLDACRDNPFVEQLKRSIGLTRAAGAQRGLAKLDTPQGTIVAYATQAGRTADDGSGRNSPYTAAFLRHIEAPEEIGTLFRRISADVYAATGQTQLPELSLSLIGEFYLRGRPSGQGGVASVQPPPADDDAAARRDYELAERVGTRAAWDAFLQRHPRGFLADLARTQRDRTAALDPRPSGTSPPPQPSPPQPPADTRGDPSAPQLRWRLTSSFPRAIENGGDVLLKRVAELSGGRFQIQLFHAGELVPGLQAADAVTNGTVELAYTLGSYYFGKDPAFTFLSGSPFGLEPRAQLAWRRRSDVGAAVNRFLAAYGIVAMPCGAFSRPDDLLSRKPIAGVADLNGLKMRVSGWAGRVYAALKAVNQQVAAGDIYPALEKGTLDAVQWATPRSTVTLGFNKVTRYDYYPGVVVPAMIVDLFVGKRVWDELAPANRQVLERACADAVDAMLADYETADRAALTTLKAGGTVIEPLPAPVQKELLGAYRRLASETAAQNAVFRSLLQMMDAMGGDTLAAKIR